MIFIIAQQLLHPRNTAICRNFTLFRLVEVKFTLGKSNRLKQKKAIDQLFNEGKHLTAFPLRLIYMKTPSAQGIKVGFSVSKRNHKKAVSRNRIKRLLRETFRLLRPIYFNNSSTSYTFMILYISKKGTSFAELLETMKALLEKFNNETTPHENL